jgi:ParB-like chromosome segregation protein Spo0J
VSGEEGAVLAVTPEGKLRRLHTPVIAAKAGVPVQVAVGVLLAAYKAGTVGRMERGRRESWWRWPVTARKESDTVSAQAELDLDGIGGEEPAGGVAGIVDEARALFERLADVPEDERIDVVNEIRLALREHSPMRREPVDCVLWVRQEQVHANQYNPNTVAPPEMELLKLSIMSDGYTQPIVAWPDDEQPDGYEIVDGFHRNRVGREVGGVAKRVHGRLPISVINAERTAKEDRIAATIRHNRARGVHQVDAMSEIVMDLARRNWSDERIGRELGMEPDEVLRLKQITGLAELFADEEFSEAWEATSG